MTLQIMNDKLKVRDKYENKENNDIFYNQHVFDNKCYSLI